MSQAKYLVRPSGPLSGSIDIRGAKNSVLKLMVATLLAQGRHVLENVPEITDVKTMSELLVSLGATVTFLGEGRLMIDTPSTEHIVPVARYELVERLRASIVVLGALLGRCGSAQVSMPGGDDFGSRPIDYHIEGLNVLGARVRQEHGYVHAESDGLVGGRVVLEFPSHTATDNLLLASVLAKGHTTIENAAREPEICDLAEMLNAMGAQIRGAGTSRIEVDGVDHLVATTHRVIPDRVEAATYLAAVGVSSGEILLNGARADHMETLLRKLRLMGIEVDEVAGGLRATSDGKIRSVDVQTLPFPGVATDYQPLIVTLLSIGDGVSVVTENLFSGRFRYIDELQRMGTDITTDGHHVVIRGRSQLHGAQVRAHDIRAGVSLIIAGLVASGESEILGIEHIERGYEAIDLRLSSLGAKIERVEGERHD